MRLFVGIGLVDQVRTQLALLDHRLKGARWVAKANLHVTLRFIGEVSEDVGDDVLRALAGVRAAPFALTLSGLGVFPEHGHPHLLWAAVEDRPAGSLQNLYGAVETALVGAGLAAPDHATPDHAYVPHATVARLKGVRQGEMMRYLARNEAMRIPEFAVEGFTLYRSYLQPQGAVYETLVEYSLEADYSLGAE